VKWEPLPATKDEVRDVARILAGREPAVVLTGPEASKARLEALARGKRVLHLATHGFFLDAPCVRSLPGTRGIGGLAERAAAPPVGPLPRSVREESLLLSGLVLAGANRAAEGPRGLDDGILTAEEIVALDLRGVDLVVLSACSTGRGRAQVGEGLFGLRRVLELAGARTVVTSLWPVPDRRARSWMGDFYRAFRTGAGPGKAARSASLAALKRLRKERLPEHPYAWAGFLAAGDWR
jgi:CHAT domain-containing protein